MSTPPFAPSPDASETPDPVTPVPVTRALLWSIRREVWENRSVYMAPLAVAAIVLLAASVTTMRLPGSLGGAALDAARQHSLVVRPYRMAPAPIMLATFVVGMFFALDALYGERRDRSILFWKSLPVSDLTTVAAKASIPLLVLPAIALALSVIVLFLLMAVGSGALLANGMSPGFLWAKVRPFSEVAGMVYGLAVHALWFAPIYAWLMLVSAWARRTPILWAASPFFALAAVEKLAFNTAHVGSFLRYRLGGAMTEAFVAKAHSVSDGMETDPLRFVASTGLWSGLAVAAVLFAAAVRIRRRGEPI